MPAARALGARPVQVRGGHRLAEAGSRRAGSRGEPRQGPQNGSSRLWSRRYRRQGVAHPVPRGAPLLRALLPGDVPPAGDTRRADRGRDARQPAEPRPDPGASQERPRRHLRPAAHGRLRAGGPLGDPGRRRLVHHRGRTAQARLGLRALAEVPREPRHGGAADDRRPAPVRGDGAAAARWQAGVHRGRQGPVRHRRGSRLLRREGTAAGRPGRAGRADRGGADARVVLVRG